MLKRWLFRISSFLTTHVKGFKGHHQRIGKKIIFGDNIALIHSWKQFFKGLICQNKLKSKFTKISIEIYSSKIFVQHEWSSIDIFLSQINIRFDTMIKWWFSKLCSITCKYITLLIHTSNPHNTKKKLDTKKCPRFSSPLPLPPRRMI